MIFEDREDAGRQLAAQLSHLKDEDVVVLGLPRGGVPVGYEIAQALGVPLDVLVVRKLGVPYQRELAMGAIGEGDVRVLDEDRVHLARVSADELAAVEAAEREELNQRVRRFRGDRAMRPVSGRTAVVVDDGMATGSTAQAACRVARALGATRIVLAVPIASPSAVELLREDADEVVCLDTPAAFFAIGQFYADFSQTRDNEVITLLRRASGDPRKASTRSAWPGGGCTDEDVDLDVGEVRLTGRLTVPGDASGVVVFAHGSGSSRHSPRNQFVAGVLNRAGLGTLLFDLLTPNEELDRQNVFDVALLGERLAGVTAWLREHPATRRLLVGYFGASTGAAAALSAAAAPDADVAAVVCRGGRPDLAADRLGAVRAPTLLIVGGHDPAVVDLNREAKGLLECVCELHVVPGATHLFDEPGALEAVAHEAMLWFRSKLTR